MATSNQSEKEFFALVTTGRQGVESAMENYGGEIFNVSASNVKGGFDTWKTRAIVEISNREELKDVISTKTGVLSVFKALTKAATMGLQIGGQFPHCYFVPKSGSAVLVTTADGYAFAAVHGPGAVLMSVPVLGRVFEKDTFSIDSAAGTFAHNFDPFADRGKLLGYFMRLEYKDGHFEIPFISRTEVEGISNSYSTKTYKDGGKAPAWAKSAEAMYDKIASKQLLKKPVKESEGLAMMLFSEDEYDEAPAPAMRDVSERTSARMDRIIAEPEPEPVVAPVVSEPVQQDIF